MSRLTRAQKQDRARASLIEAAETLFLTRGYRSTSVEETADAAGYTKGAVYSNFESKVGILEAVLKGHRTRTLAQISEFLSGSECLEDQIAAADARFNKDPSRARRWALLEFELVLVAAEDDDMKRAVEERNLLFRGQLGRVVVEEAQRTGLPDVPLSPGDLAEAIVAVADGLRLRLLLRPEGTPRGFFASCSHSSWSSSWVSEARWATVPATERNASTSSSTSPDVRLSGCHREEVAEDDVPELRADRLRVELQTHCGHIAACDRHHGAVLRASRHAETVRDRVRSDDQRVIAHHRQRAGQGLEDSRRVMEDPGGLAVDDPLGSDDAGPMLVSDGLMSEADAENWDPSLPGAEQHRAHSGDPGVRRVPGPRRKHHVCGSECLDSRGLDEVVAHHERLGAGEEPDPLVEVVYEAVVVVDDEDAHATHGFTSAGVLFAHTSPAISRASNGPLALSSVS